jgi:hypothetical protein
MSSSFKPLLTAVPAEANKRATFTARVVRQPAASPFQAAAPAHAHGPSAAAGSGEQPKVTVERQGDRISRIIVTCSCGEVIELDCRY